MSILVALLSALLKSIVVGVFQGLLHWTASVINRFADRKIGKGVLEHWFWHGFVFAVLFWINLVLYPQHPLSFKVFLCGCVSLLAILYYKLLIAFWESDGTQKYEWTAAGDVLLEPPSLAMWLRRRFPPTQTHTLFTTRDIVATHPSVVLRAANVTKNILLFTLPAAVMLALSILIHQHAWLFCVKATFAAWVVGLAALVVLAVLFTATIVLTAEYSLWLDRTKIKGMKTLSWILAMAFFIWVALLGREPRERPTALGWLSHQLRNYVWGWDELVTFIKQVF